MALNVLSSSSFRSHAFTGLTLCQLFMHSSITIMYGVLTLLQFLTDVKLRCDRNQFLMHHPRQDKYCKGMLFFLLYPAGHGGLSN